MRFLVCFLVTWGQRSPELVERDDDETAAEPALVIKEGRHLLQELCSEVCIPNDTELGGHAAATHHASAAANVDDVGDEGEAYGAAMAQPDDGPRLVLLTAPNASGKSVYMKQVATIVFLAHTGCFVPASSAVVPVVDRIFSRVYSHDTLLRGRSTFLVDLMQASRGDRGSAEGGAGGGGERCRLAKHRSLD